MTMAEQGINSYTQSLRFAHNYYERTTIKCNIRG